MRLAGLGAGCHSGRMRTASISLFALLFALGCSDDASPAPDAAIDSAVDTAAPVDGDVADAAEDAGPPVVGDVETFADLGSTAEGIALAVTAAGETLYVGLRGGGGIVTVSPTGEVTTFADVPGVLGMAARADGGLVACGRADASDAAVGVIWQVAADGTAEVLIAADAAGADFSLTNYIAVAPDDSLVFTDSDAENIYRADADGANVELLTADISYPNGLAFSADGAKLYAASWDGDAVFAATFDAATGSYGAFELAWDAVAAVDGLVTAADESVYLITSGTGVLRVAPASAETTSIVDNRAILLPANGVFGQGEYGSDWIYIAALGSPRVHRIFVDDMGPALPIR